MTIWLFLLLLVEVNVILAAVLLLCWARKIKRDVTATVAKNKNIWESMQDQPYISKRFALKKYLGWTDNDIDNHLGSS